MTPEAFPEIPDVGEGGSLSPRNARDYHWKIDRWERDRMSQDDCELVATGTEPFPKEWDSAVFFFAVDRRRSPWDNYEYAPTVIVKRTTEPNVVRLRIVSDKLAQG